MSTLQKTICRHRLVAIAMTLAVLGLALKPGSDALAPTAFASEDVLAQRPTPADAIEPPGLPEIGKWMIDRNGTIAHWLGEIHEGKALREPINVILIDHAADSAEKATLRLIAASTAAGYPIRLGHSTGYRGYIGGNLYMQLPKGWDDAFSNGVFELSNNHGRIFGPHRFGEAYVFIAAFSREEIRPFHWPEHGYASFNRAREDFSRDLDRSTPFKLQGFVNLENAIVGDPRVGTGDHDGRAAMLRAER